MSCETPAPGRIDVIDAIRGLAVMGILFANIQSWSGYKFIPLTDIAELPFAELDGVLNLLHLWVVDGKFYAIFSMLFGAGFGLQYLKNRQRMDQFLPVYRRRLAFLLLFGILHALLWSGDILTLYALLAFVMVWLRDLSRPQVFALVVFLLVAFVLPQILMMLFGPKAAPQSDLAHHVYPDVSPAGVTAAYGAGDWGEVFRMNLHNLYWRWMDFLPNGRISRVLGLFMLGFFLVQSRYFREQVSQFRWIVIWSVIGLTFSYAAFVMGANISRWAVSWNDLLAKLMLVAGQVTLALAYMSVVGFLYENSVGRWLLHPLTLIGRMAFTSYLSQTLIGITIFYGVGFAYFGTMGLAQLYLLALAIYSVQVLIASVWLRLFWQGPVEWFWGCLTRKQWKTNRRFLVPPSNPTN